MAEDWKSKVLFTNPQAATVEIDNREFKFYPISVKAALKLRLVAAPIVTALSTLFGGQESDTGKKVREITGQGRETIIDPIAADLATLRADQRERSINSVVETLTDEGTLTIVGALLADSLRDVFPRDVKEVVVTDWVKGLDLDKLVEFVKGLMKGNERVFGPLGAQAATAAKKALDGLGSKLEEQPKAPSPSTIRPHLAG